MAQFDPSSGLVFTERLAPVRSMVPAWTTNSRGKRVNPSRSLQLRCSSLQEMALRACVWNVDNMEPEALKWLGWPYARRLYDRLKATWVKDCSAAISSAVANPSIAIHSPFKPGVSSKKRIQKILIGMLVFGSRNQTRRRDNFPLWRIDCLDLMLAC